MSIESGFDPNKEPRNPEEDRIEEQPNTSEAVIEAGKLVIHEGAYGRNIVYLKSIEGDRATICQDVTDHDVTLPVSLDSLSPIQKIEIPEELRR